jgi:hypothetical protein
MAVRCRAMQEVWSAAYDGEDYAEALSALNTIEDDQARRDQPSQAVERFHNFSFEAVEDHFSTCPTCSSVTRTTASFRRLRIRTVDTTSNSPSDTPIVDLRSVIRAAITNDRMDAAARSGRASNLFASTGRRDSMAPSVLIALLVTGLAQALGALPDLFGSFTGGGLASAFTGVEHLTREAAASEIALSAGFVYVACRPFAIAAVRVFASVLTVLILIGTLISGIVTDGVVTLETHHLIAAFGTALLWLLPKKSAELFPWGIRSSSHSPMFPSSFAASPFRHSNQRGTR